MSRRALLWQFFRLRQSFVRLKWKLLLGPALRLGRNVHIDPGVRFELISDGAYRGGVIVIGDGCSLSHGVVLAPYGGVIELKDFVSISAYSVLYGHGGLVVGRKTMIAAHCTIVPASHGHKLGAAIYDQPETRRGITIGNEAWVAANCQILDGVSIGDGAVIAAGSVVRTDIPPMTIAAGVPATIVRQRA